jgi:putative flippase GtrA
LRSVIFPAVAAGLQTASSRGMATRLNFPNKTFAQLVRFAIVGFSLAGLYSAIYWVLARYVMPPVFAVAVAFLVSVSIGFVLHSRWSFRGHGAREDHLLKVKFLAVQFSGFLLNEAFTWLLTGPMHGPIWWPLIPAIFVTPLATFALNKQLVFR